MEHPMTETTAATTTSRQSSGLRQYEMAVFWLWAVGIPIVLLLGTFGNVMSILVVRHLKKELYALRITMTSLAISDTVCLWITGIAFFCPKVIKFDVLGSHVFFCKVGLWLIAISAIFSIWFIVILTFLRAISVYWPLKLRAFCTRKASRVVVVSPVLIIAVCYSHMLYGAELQVNNRLGEFSDCFFSANSDYMYFWDEIWTKVDLLISAIVPAILIIGCNITLSITLVKNKMRMRSACAYALINRRAARDQNTVFTITLIMGATVVFLFLTMPFSFCLALFGSGKTPEQMMLFETTLFMYYCNYGINFFVFIITGTRYRQTLKAMFVYQGAR